MIQDQKGFKENNIRAESEEEQTIIARTKLHEKETKYTGIMSAARENKGTKTESRQQKYETSKQDSTRIITAALVPPPVENQRKQKIKIYHPLQGSGL